jgi:predicted phosphoribosyltransferase
MFASREEAGRRLGGLLAEERVQADVVLGLPRGGVVVAAEVAKALAVKLDVLVVRKIGHPMHREFAIGALAEGGVVILDERAIARNPVIRIELEQVIAEEQERLRNYQARFHREGVLDLAGKRVLLVDDGLATGSTTEAAVLSARSRQAASILVAAPVGSTSAVDRLERVADQVRVLHIDPNFDAVGRYYDEFSQTTDDEVIQLLPAR